MTLDVPNDVAFVRRPLPDRDKVEAALAHVYDAPRPRVDLTVIMKLHKPSQRKIDRLLSVHCYVTNLRAKILQHYKEDPDCPRTDGAIGLVMSVGRRSKNRAQRVGTLIYSQFITPTLNKEVDYQFSVIMQ